VEIGRIVVSDQPGKKVGETPSSTKKLGMMEHIYNCSYVRDIVGGSQSRQAQITKNARSYWK
jgi:hypothetical protein